MATRRTRPWHPPANRESFRDLLLVEERLIQNAQRLQKQRRKYEAFLITLIAVIVYLAYLVFIVPSIYSLVHYGNVAMLLVAGTTLVLFFATGMYAEKIAYAYKFVPQANRALRPFNIYLNTRHRSRFSIFNLFRSPGPPAVPASPALSRTSSGRSVSSELSSPPSSRRTSASSSGSSSIATFRSGGALRSPSNSPPASPPLGVSQTLPSPPPSPTIDDGPVTRAPVPLPSPSAPARGVPIPPIPPAQNPRGELIFSSRVSPQFREGYERYRGEWEKRRAEAKRLREEREGGWKAWLAPWRWSRSRSASPAPSAAAAAAGSAAKGLAVGGANGDEKVALRRSLGGRRSREPSASPSEGSFTDSPFPSQPPSRAGSPPLDPLAGAAAPWASHSRAPSPDVGFATSTPPVLPSSTSTPASSRSPSPAPSSSLSPQSASAVPGRVRAESFSELISLTDRTENAHENELEFGGGGERPAGLSRSGSMRRGLSLTGSSR
ncbi:hypothetical protein JCM10207_009171 [Rhodosporidiobolus poonsookiae]